MKNKFAGKLVEMLVPGLAGLGMLLLIPSQVNQESFVDRSQSSSLFPTVIAWSLIILSCFQAAKYLRKRDDSEPSAIRLNRSFLLGLAVYIAYVILIPYLGFLLASVLNTLCMIFVMGRNKWHKALLYSILFSLIVWFAFKTFLHVPFPEGILGI